MTLINSCVFVVLVCSAFFANCVISTTLEEEREAMHKVREQCVKELGLDHKSGQGSTVPPAVVREKIMPCVFKGTGEMTDDGKFALDVTVAKIKLFAPDKDQQEKMIAIVTECEKEINSAKRSDEETAKMIGECFDKIPK